MVDLADQPPGLTADQISGVVLAGGTGRRMGGVDKGLQRFHGRPLALHAAQRLAPQVAHVMISANQHLDAYREWGWPVLMDLPEHASQGPLAGMLAALDVCQTPWLACVPCDVPLFPIDLVRRLAADAHTVPLVYACAPDRSAQPAATPRRHPTCCLLHRSLRATLAAYLRAGGRRLDAWMRSQPHAEVRFDDAEAFANLNTAADLAQAEQRPPQAG